MRKYIKSKIVLYFNLIISLLLIIGSIICFANINKTNIHLGIDLYLVFGIILSIFTLPFVLNIMRYIFLPNTVLTVSRDEFTIYKKKKNITIRSSRLLGVSKVTNIKDMWGLDVGTLKILLNDRETPYIVRFVDELDSAYQVLSIMSLKYKNIR